MGNARSVSFPFVVQLTMRRGSLENMSAKLPKDVAGKWMHEDIPYRVIAGIIMSDIEQTWEPGPLTLNPAGLKSLGLNYAALEGRRVAVRWLIEYIGLKQGRKSCLPEESDAGAERDETDCGLIRIPGGVNHTTDPNNPNAVFLANVWRGCVQATSHPTIGTEHFDVGHTNLNKAIGIIIDHLQSTIYDHEGLKLRDVVDAYWRRRYKAV